MGRDQHAIGRYIREKQYAGLHLEVKDEMSRTNVPGFGEWESRTGPCCIELFPLGFRVAFWFWFDIQSKPSVLRIYINGDCEERRLGARKELL